MPKQDEKKKKSRDRLSTPPTGAGLLIFYEETPEGAKVGPRFVFIAAFLLIFGVIAMWYLFPP
ncbi:MAG: preprotein translocase subunit Sec61beta [Crenarchaeota archaeon]|nr:preprotein translocase subunit Sec61beta [Thermoproteota archaeon]MCR8453888.1 preprotein translocase subunit Sec61beta [Thermoproteota archaeon]MCR8455294.1 preprotein translocase subunit Sec61beta [Thermoproteota archaeon]MCR8462563.1 preprotein translocase subunit Sec61beta [Thermoproteota archaeon]MCR8470709.1 preprotein translocase subunit Sec61beta [Thermoproteota archaeon]